MTPQLALTVGQDALTLLLMIAMPVLGVVMAVGGIEIEESVIGIEKQVRIVRHK